MSNNLYTVSTLKKRRQDFDEFDTLPKEVKEIIWYAPWHAATMKNISSLSATQLRRAYDAALVKFSLDSARTYGPTHPGAHLAIAAGLIPRHTTLAAEDLF